MSGLKTFRNGKTSLLLCTEFCESLSSLSPPILRAALPLSCLDVFPAPRASGSRKHVCVRRPDLDWIEYITVNRTVSLSKFSFFKLLHLLIRSYQVPVLLICPLALSHFLEFKVFMCQLAVRGLGREEGERSGNSSHSSVNRPGGTRPSRLFCPPW